MGILGNFRTATFENGFEGRFLNENRGGEGRTVTHPIFYQEERSSDFECVIKNNMPNLN